MRNFAKVEPFEVKCSSGSATRLPTREMTGSPAILGSSREREHRSDHFQKKCAKVVRSVRIGVRQRLTGEPVLSYSVCLRGDVAESDLALAVGESNDGHQGVGGIDVSELRMPRPRRGLLPHAHRGIHQRQECGEAPRLNGDHLWPLSAPSGGTRTG